MSSGGSRAPCLRLVVRACADTQARTNKGAGGSEGARARVDRAAQVAISGGRAHSPNDSDPAGAVLQRVTKQCFRSPNPLAMTPQGARGTLEKPQTFTSDPYAVTEGKKPSQEGGLSLHKHKHTKRPTRTPAARTALPIPPSLSAPRDYYPSPLGRTGYTQTWPAHCLGTPPPRQPG